MNNNILLLDNNDSFTYNIVDLVRKIDNVNLKVVKTNSININDIKIFSKIIISPGPGLPDDFPNLFKILKTYAGKIPILGICLGHQTITSFFGAKLKRIVPVVHGQAHTINILKPSPLFRNIPLTFNVGLYHSWAVSDEMFPKDLLITAASKQNVIMAVQSKSKNIFGLQFHPESHLTEFGLQIISNFISLNNNIK